MNKDIGRTIGLPFSRGLLALLGVAVLLMLARPAVGQGFLTVANPDWNITLSDFGYSDFLLDNTPGFQGREYLSGEWGAAIGYQVASRPIVTPQWLEPHFSYPDWTTPSTFGVVSPLAQLGLNASGLPIARSVISNADVQITLDYEMIDTVVGTPMGTMPASGGGAGAFINSDRYVLKQTYTVKNISGSQINSLELFQFLHGLQSQRGVYDNRLHAGPLSSYRYDVTLVGVDAFAVGPGSSAAGLEDIIGFQSSVVPTAYEIGYYGIEGNGVDNHVLGKPVEGVHLSIEDNWQTMPYVARQNTDVFAPSQRWIAGAQRWTLGTLQAGQSISLDVLLSVCTGTKIDTGLSSGGGCNGGVSVPGGLDVVFDDVTDAGSCFAEYSQADASELEIRIANGEFLPLTFPMPGGPVQMWKVSFSGTYSGSVTLSFAYDPMLLPPGFDASTLCLYEFDGAAWQLLPGSVDPVAHTITVTVINLASFALGVDGATAYTVTASPAPSGGGSITGDGTYLDGSSVSLAAVANEGYAFSNWTENAVVVSVSPNYTFIVYSNRTLEAHFTVAGPALTVATSSQPGNAGVTSGDGVYAGGSSASVKAIANDGYKFSKWMVNGVAASTQRSYTFTVTTNVALVAMFKPVYKIVISPDPPEGGEVEVDAGYELGEVAKPKAVPFPGYAFVNWTEHDLVVSTDVIYAFNVGGNRELVGHFAAGNRIDVSVDPAHSGTASGGGVHPVSANVEVIAEANPGYVFVNWTENGSVVSTSTVYNLASDAGHTLVAHFLAQPMLRQALAQAGGLLLSWPGDTAGWSLQERQDLQDGTWTNSVRAVDTVGALKQVTISPLSGNGFFRLIHP